MQILSRLNPWFVFPRRRPWPAGLSRLDTGERRLAVAPVSAQMTALADALGEPTVFADYVRPTLVQYSRFVQAITVARVSLLEQGLTLARQALTRRPATAVADHDDPTRFHYALLSALWLRQASQAARQVVTLYDARGRSLGPWCPLQGPMDSVTGAAGYAVAPDAENDRLPGLPALLAPVLLPAAAVAWLFHQPALATDWLAVLHAVPDAESHLATWVHDAEGTVTTEEEAPTAVTPASPLPGLLREALRALVVSRDTRFNQREGLGWRQGNQLYLVGKQVAQGLRGDPALQPYRPLLQVNEAVYRLLREHDLTTGDPTKPIITVQVTDATGTTVMAAVLQAPISRLWDDPTQAPAEFNGVIQPKPTPSAV